MKKIISTLFLLFSFYVFSIVPTSNAESSNTKYTVSTNTAEMELENKMADLENKIRVQNLIKYIESECEIIVPSHIDTKYIEYTYNLANELKIPTRTAFRLMYKESNFRDTVVSKVGAQGLMQLMPKTRSKYYELLRIDTLNLDKNQQDIYIGMNMMNDLYEFWLDKGYSEKTSWILTLASYNAGKGNVIKYKGIPPYKETQDFVTFILKTHSNPQFFANYSRKYENQIKIST